MNDPGLNNLLKWSIENSAASRNDPSAPAPTTQLNTKALQQFMGPSPANRMTTCMETIKSEKSTLDAKINAFEDLEHLIQKIDNAINLEGLQLWGDLIDQLSNEEPELRSLAAETIGAIPTLVKLGTEDENKQVRKKAVRALSTFSRNFQPGLDAVIENVPKQFKPKDKIDAGDMDSVDILIDPLRAHAARNS